MASIFFNITCNILIIFGVNFFYIEYGYSESGNLVFYFTVMYGLGMLISQASYASLAKRFFREKILKVCFLVLLVGYGCFLGFGYVLIPVVALIISYTILRKKYHIDEKEYAELIGRK